MRSFITSLKSLGPDTVPCGVPAPTTVVFQPNNNQTSGYTMERLVQKTKQERDKPII